MARFDKTTKPIDGRTLVIYCPGYCEMDYIIGRYTKGIYESPDANELLDDFVKGRCYVDLW